MKCDDSREKQRTMETGGQGFPCTDERTRKQDFSEEAGHEEDGGFW